ncbi:hypothetical protein ACTFIZ_000149 [Dictyostelium cf. discoideum]
MPQDLNNNLIKVAQHQDSVIFTFFDYNWTNNNFLFKNKQFQATVVKRGGRNIEHSTQTPQIQQKHQQQQLTTTTTDKAKTKTTATTQTIIQPSDETSQRYRSTIKRRTLDLTIHNGIWRTSSHKMQMT